MSLLLKIAYYGVGSIATLLTLLYLFMGVINAQPDRSYRQRRLLTLSSVASLGMLYLAFRSGHQAEHWGMGLLWIAAAAVAFLCIMMIGMHAVKVNWQ